MTGTGLGPTDQHGAEWILPLAGLAMVVLGAGVWIFGYRERD